MFFPGYRIHEALTHALYAESTNWPSKIHNHALSLLRTGECTTFPELMRRVLQDVRRDSTSTGPAGSVSNPTTTNGANGSRTKEGSKDKDESPAPETANGIAQAIANGKGRTGEDSLAVPRAVIDEGLKVTRECLEQVCELED
jgi:hypothetical protein